MPEAAPTPDRDRPAQSGRHSSARGRRLGKALVPGIVFGVILTIVAVLLLVTQCGSSVDGVSQGDGPGSTGAATVSDAGPALAVAPDLADAGGTAR